MLENAKRQLFLVLLTIVAGIACCLTLEVPLGHDLAGGTQLRYELPRDVLDELVKKEKGVTIEEVMRRTIEIITERIDPTGALDPRITRSGETGIVIELPYFKDKQELKRVRERVGNLGKLEMRMVADDDYAGADGTKFMMAAEVQRLKAWLQVPENKAAIAKDFREVSQFNESQNGPMAFGNLAWFPRLIRPKQPDPKQTTLIWDDSYTKYQNSVSKIHLATVPAWEDSDFNGGVVPESMLQKAPQDRYLVEFVALNMHEQHFTGDNLDASGIGPAPSGDGGIGVAYQITPDLTGDYQEWSRKYIGKCSAIVLNGVIKSAPSFRSEIPGNGIISGDFTREEVDELVKVLRTGSLRVEPELVSSESIGPTLGRKAIDRGAISLVAGAVLVFGFMLFYYRVAGTIACMTLVLNVFLLWAAMLFMQATITLPGLGGIVLTMGMAVDANVLIYERIREELAKGKDLLRSVRAGFERAMSAILDSNITTFLIGLVLFNVGVGPVRGFAVTLMVGIVTTVFTQFFVTRLLFHYALLKNWLVDYKPRSLFANLNVDFVRHIGKAVAASTIVIVAGLAAVFMAPRETVLGIDFTGGANLKMVLSAPMTDEAVREALGADAAFAAAYPNAEVNRYLEEEEQESGTTDGPGTRFNVRLKLDDRQRTDIEAARKAHRQLREKAATENLPPPPPYEPPYVLDLRRLFESRLVKPAFSAPVLTPKPQGDNLQFAQVDVFMQQPVRVAEARELLAKTLPLSTVSALGDENAVETKELRVEWTAQKSLKAWEVPELVQKEMKGLKDVTGKDIVLSDPFPEAQEIQGRLVDYLRNAAIGALVLAWGLIVLYLRVRFHEYKYGIAAVVALIHDVLIALIAVVVCNQLGLVHAEINLAMIACFLTIIGYSVNDTIVIFDRIRENAHENARLGVTESFRVLINRALNQTMSRTLLTSGLTLLVVIAQFAVNFGSGSDLESFAFAMIVGMVSGVYSTIYIAAPILIWLDRGDLAHPKPEAPATTVPANTPVA